MRVGAGMLLDAVVVIYHNHDSIRHSRPLRIGHSATDSGARFLSPCYVSEQEENQPTIFRHGTPFWLPRIIAIATSGTVYDCHRTSSEVCILAANGDKIGNLDRGGNPCSDFALHLRKRCP